MWRRARRPCDVALEARLKARRTCCVSITSFPATRMCQRHTQGDRAVTTEIAEGLPDLDPICELPPLALPLDDYSQAAEPCAEEPLDEAPLLRNRSGSEVFGQPDEPYQAPSIADSMSTCVEPVLTELLDQSPRPVVAPRPAVLVSKEGHEVEVSDVSPSAAIVELVDAAWRASSTSRIHSIVRVYMPFSTASVRKAAAMIEACTERRQATLSRKRKLPPAQQHPAPALLRHTVAKTGECFSQDRLHSRVWSSRGYENHNAA